MDFEIPPPPPPQNRQKLNVTSLCAKGQCDITDLENLGSAEIEVTNNF